MARANQQWETLRHSPVLIIFTGPEHYISPSWYKTKEEHGNVVPTWNYAAVHVTGRARVFEGEALYPHLRQLTAANETAHGLPWRIEDAPRSYVDGLIKAVVGIEIQIDRIEGKWKMSQNRPARDRESVIAALEALGTPGSAELGSEMKSRR
jgi:transcriptional regulator